MKSKLVRGLLEVAVLGGVLMSATAHAQGGPNTWCGWTPGDECCMPINVTPFCENGLTCVDGICQDFAAPTDIDRLPVLTMDLRVTSCNDASQILMGGSGPTYRVEIGNREPFYIDTVETLFQSGAVNQFGLRVPGVNRLEDISDVRFFAQNADLCVSRVELIVNDLVVFEKNFDPFRRLIGTLYPTVEDHLDLTGDELRSSWRQIDPTGACGIPTGISGPALQRTVTAVLGDALAHAGGSSSSGGGFTTTIRKAELREDDFVRLTQAGPSTVHVQTRFHASVNVSANGGPLGIDAGVTMQIGFDITPSCNDADPNDTRLDDNAISLDVSPITLEHVDGDVLIDALISIFSPQSDIAQTLNARLDGVRDSFRNVARELPVCPPIAVDGGSPAGIQLPLDPFSLLIAEGIAGHRLSICR